MGSEFKIGRPKATDGATLVWSRYGQELHRFLLNRLRSSQDARDLAQEVYLRLLRVGKDEVVHDFRSYMYRIAAHVVYEYRYRTRDSHVSFDSEAVKDWDEQFVGASDESYERVSTEQQLEQLFETLTPHCKAVFMLYTHGCLSRTEIADRLGLSAHTVKKYLTRAIATLRAAEWDSR